MAGQAAIQFAATGPPAPRLAVDGDACRFLLMLGMNMAWRRDLEGGEGGIPPGVTENQLNIVAPGKLGLRWGGEKRGKRFFSWHPLWPGPTWPAPAAGFRMVPR